MSEYCHTYVSHEIKINLEMVFNDKYNFKFMVEQLERIKNPTEQTKTLIKSLKESLNKFWEKNKNEF